MLRDPCTLTLLGIICVAGCGPSSTHGVSESVVGWTSSCGKGVPGIDEASVTQVTLKGGPPDGISFVVWSDLPKGGFAHGRSNVDCASYCADHRGQNGRSVEFQCAIRDGKVTPMRIAHCSYDLANGSLFLVSTKAASPRVAQLDVDVQDFPIDIEGLKKLSSVHPDIRDFFRNHHAATLDQEWPLPRTR